jgi:hypothetical protein
MSKKMFKLAVIVSAVALAFAIVFFVEGRRNECVVALMTALAVAFVAVLYELIRFFRERNRFCRCCVPDIRGKKGMPETRRCGRCDKPPDPGFRGHVIDYDEGGNVTYIEVADDGEFELQWAIFKGLCIERIILFRLGNTLEEMLGVIDPLCIHYGRRVLINDHVVKHIDIPLEEGDRVVISNGTDPVPALLQNDSYFCTHPEPLISNESGEDICLRCNRPIER